MREQHHAAHHSSNSALKKEKKRGKMGSRETFFSQLLKIKMYNPHFLSLQLQRHVVLPQNDFLYTCQA